MSAEVLSAQAIGREEVRPELDPGQFTLANAMDRFSRVGDLFGGVLKMPQNLAHAFGRLEKLIVGQALSPARSSN